MKCFAIVVTVQDLLWTLSSLGKYLTSQLQLFSSHQAAKATHNCLQWVIIGEDQRNDSRELHCSWSPKTTIPQVMVPFQSILKGWKTIGVLSNSPDRKYHKISSATAYRPYLSILSLKKTTTLCIKHSYFPPEIFSIE